ncbi:hypothetical protein F2P81_018122 [Scophthalmus maximus]|uniref:Uncharacterized protein n=1 Tax=Scophthalmus maximus TaxID=52904 RepID=A0A6A4S7D4_SCOMX|nr:hypothetical protein F2P81_018122 [Scophthalmus maximus]
MIVFHGFLSEATISLHPWTRTVCRPSSSVCHDSLNATDSGHTVSLGVTDRVYLELRGDRDLLRFFRLSFGLRCLRGLGDLERERLP